MNAWEPSGICSFSNGRLGSPHAKAVAFMGPVLKVITMQARQNQELVVLGVSKCCAAALCDAAVQCKCPRGRKTHT